MADASFTHLVVVGSSAGGIEALSELVSSLPDNFPAPVVIAQHLDPARESNLREILARKSTLPVHTVTDHTPLEAGVIFVVPAGRHVNITDSELDLRVNTVGRPKPSVDLLMSSAAKVYGERLIAVVLTGTGSDGAGGARDVRRAGGTVVVQDPETAAFSGMPGSLVPSTVDITAGLDDIGPILKELLSDTRLLEEPRDEDEKQYLESFLEELRERYGMDFTSYKMPTIMRRLKRRMVATNSDSIEDYRRHLNDYPEEYRQLINSFLIKVTEFFRDPELFDYLREEILPRLIEKAREEGSQIRIWSAGCATGEEAYSLAILLSEVLGDEAGRFDARIFATDIDEEAVEFARRGVYSASALEGLSEEQVSRYFIEDNDQYQVKKQVRSSIIFGEHDLGRRSPFPRIDLVVSRNVLIYFAPELQRRSLQLFAYSLRDGGYLVLGKAETPSPLGEFYAPEDARLRVYRRQGERFLLPPPVPVSPVPNLSRLGYGQGTANLRASRELPAEPRRTRAPDEGLLNRLPVGVVVVDRRYDIQSINATARRLLSIRGAAIGEDLLHATREVPYEEVRHAIDSAFRNGESTGTEEFPVQDVTTGGSRHLRLICHPLRGENESRRAETVVIAIQDITEEVRAQRELEEQLEKARSEFERLESASRTETTRREAQNERLVETNRQLEEANQELSAINEELETLNEEALLSTEEAQAVTEEVETLNEELQATNEELETLNEELQATIEELNTTNDDLSARSTELQALARTNGEERRRAEGARRRLEEILTRNPSAMMAVLRGPEHVLEFATEAYASATGRTRAALLGKRIREAFPEFEGQGFFEKLDQVYASGEPCVIPESLIGVDRGGSLEETFMDLTYQPLRDMEDEVEGVMIYKVDRTEQVQLRRRVEELEAVLHVMSDLVLAVNEREEVLFRNGLFEEVFGDGANLSESFAPLSEDGQQLPSEATPQARVARGESFEMRFTVKENGERRSFEARGRPTEGGGGVVVIREV